MSHSRIKVLEIRDKNMAVGGEERFLMNLFSHIDRNVFQIECLVTSDCSSDDYRKMLNDLGIRLSELGIQTDRRIFKNILFRPVLKFLSENRFDVVHIHSSSVVALAVLSSAAYRAGVKTIIVHSHTSGLVFNWKYKGIRALASLYLSKHVTYYCACSKEAAEWKFIPKYSAQTYIVPNGINCDQFRYNPRIRSEYREKLNIPDSTYVIGNVGRFVYNKNQQFAVEVFRKYVQKNPDSLLLFVGDGEDRQRIETMVKQAEDIRDKVMFIGEVLNVEAYLQVFDVFIFPSLFEGLGIAALEAECAGLPVIASDTIPREIALVDRVSFLDLNGDKSIWAEELDKYRNTERQDASRTIREKGYDIAATVKIISDLYRK